MHDVAKLCRCSQKVQHICVHTINAWTDKTVAGTFEIGDGMIEEGGAVAHTVHRLHVGYNCSYIVHLYRLCTLSGIQFTVHDQDELGSLLSNSHTLSFTLHFLLSILALSVIKNKVEIPCPTCDYIPCPSI